MLRTILALLLIANLLACPLRCAACEAGSAGAEADTSPACSCCSVDDGDPASDEPVDCPEGDCDCKNCICEGAVREISAKSIDAAVMAFESARPSVASILDRAARSPSERQARCDDGLFRSGRDARIAHQSWLI